jgi:tRNA (mo5U34)-methyltransferase
VLTSTSDYLRQVKERLWFYEFELPDGTVTRCSLSPDFLPIHASRREKLRGVLRERVPDAASLTALDLSSHEGWFTLELARHFGFVRGLEFRQDNIDAAELITRALEIDNVAYTQADLQALPHDENLSADFVLMYGLLYHLENPIHTLRLASGLCRKHLMIETQVFPYDLAGLIEDGNYQNQRPVYGVFGLAPDNPGLSVGGSTELALVPSLNALIFLLQSFGFTDIQVLPPLANDYEQYSRRSRVVIYAAK